MLKFAVKKAYFDYAKVQKEQDKKTQKALFTTGAFVRRTAQFSMKSRKKPAKPGEPPHAHKNKYLKKVMAFDVDMGKKSVVIGPLLRQETAAKHIPRLMEQGGSVHLPPTRRHKTAKDLKYAKHPYMKPALLENQDKIAGFMVAARTIK